MIPEQAVRHLTRLHVSLLRERHYAATGATGAHDEAYGRVNGYQHALCDLFGVATAGAAMERAERDARAMIGPALDALREEAA